MMKLSRAISLRTTYWTGCNFLYICSIYHKVTEQETLQHCIKQLKSKFTATKIQQKKIMWKCKLKPIFPTDFEVGNAIFSMWAGILLVGMSKT